ncbi:MAG: DUF2934 domain-containing protein [Pseudomonadota bacterium]
MARPKKAKEEEASTSSSCCESGNTSCCGGKTSDDRQELVAQLAYLKAEKRGFSGGCPEQDWFEAEKEVDQKLKKK